MKVQVNYYGILTDIASCTQEELLLEAASTLEQFKEYLIKKYPGFTDVALAFFINNKRGIAQAVLEEGQTIDCMPPFAGG